MSWIKRNLYFLLGSIVAVGLMIAGGFYLFSQISEEGRLADEFERQQNELQTLNNKNPHPGYGQINNINAAKEQSAAIRAFIKKTQPFFERIAPIPDAGGARLKDSDFASALRVTISELHHSASNQSVLLSAPDYYFTFEAQRKLMVFDPASLDKLAVQLGEVKALCDILFDAKVNSLDYVRREAVSADDKNQSDYLSQKTVSTPLADLTPYELKFRCFSAELAVVMSHLAGSHNGFIVKTINVEPSMASEEPGGTPGITQPQPVYTPRPVYPAFQDGRAARAGIVPGTVMPLAPAAAPTSHGPQLLVTEKPFAVTMLVQIIKAKAVK
jgi:hypothetical protein